jgi:hypothetical protein
MILTAQKVREILHYDPDTGVWTWLRPPAKNILVGSVAGTISVHGYRIITFQGVKYRSGRLAWLYMTGEWPVEEIDHDNRDKTDDRWCNLLDKSRSNNALNRDLQVNNFSGTRGIHFDTARGLWQVQVKKDNVSHFGGRYDDYNEAVIARDELASKLHGSFAVLTDPFCQANLYDIRGSVAMEMHT